MGWTPRREVGYVGMTCPGCNSPRCSTCFALQLPVWAQRWTAVKLTDLSPHVFSTGFSLIHIPSQNRKKDVRHRHPFLCFVSCLFRKPPESLLLNKIKKK